MANVIRSRISTTLLLVGVLASLSAGRSWAQCLGDCDGSGSVGAGELTKIIAIINYCPCPLPSVGGLASGCAAVPGTDKQCTNADRSGNGCITAGELTGVIADLLNFPSTGCPPGPTATPTTPAPTNTTLINTATPTNTTLINTATPTNTPPTPPTATPTTPAPTNTVPANTATPTNTQAIGTATATPTATTGVVTALVCGNGVATDPGEECDDGGICVGGTNAGTQCTAESQCIGQGVCDAGFKIEQVCDIPDDCPQGHCVRCRPFGGDGCAANCTLEKDVLVTLIPGTGAAKPGTSFASIHTNQVIPTSLVLPLVGHQIITVGKLRNGQIPTVIKASSVSFSSINVLAGSACACVRGVVDMTCGGYLTEKDGTNAIDCTPGSAPGTCSATTTTTCLVDIDCPSTEQCVVHACVGKKPCAFVHGPGNSATGLIGCNGLDGTNLLQLQNEGGQPQPPVGTPPPGSTPAAVIIGNSCACATDTDCGTGNTCNVAKGKCNCYSTAECAGGVLCSVAFRSNPAAGTPTPTPGSCLGICQANSACPLTQTCTAGGPGSALFVNSTAIGQFEGKCVVTPTPGHTNCAGTDHGTDCTWCTADDPARSRGVPQTLPAVTGFAEGLVYNDYFWNGSIQNIGPWAVIGGGISCSQITAPTPSFSGLGLAGAFTALNQPTIGDSVVNNLQFAK